MGIDGFSSLVEKARLGDRGASEAVYRTTFSRLRAIASHLLNRERPGHTLQPTALVSELFLKLHRFQLRVSDENHFFRLSSRAMRQVLIDHARTKKRVESADLTELSSLLADGGGAPAETQLAVKLAFEKLRSMDAVVAETVWGRCVEGLTAPELSARQRRPEWRVHADYDFGLRWMAGRLQRGR